MASEEPFSITIPPNYVHCQYVHWALLAVKYFSTIPDKDSDQGPISRLLKKNPNPAKERNLNDDLLRRYYPRFELKSDFRYYEPFNNVPYPKFAEDEFFASETFDEDQTNEITGMKSTLVKSCARATSDMEIISLQQFSRMWESVSQFKTKACDFIDGPGQVIHHLLIVHGKGSSKEAIDSSAVTLQELYKSFTKSSEEMKGEVVATRAKVEESRNSWQQLLNSDISGMHDTVTVAFEKYGEIERKTGCDLRDSRHEWKKASDRATGWQRYSLSGSSAIGLGFPDDVPSCESHFFAFEDSVLQKGVTKCDLAESKWHNPPSPELVKLLKERRGAHDEARTKLAAAGEAKIRVARIHGIAQQIVSSLGLIRDQCDKLRDGIHAIGNSVRAMDRTIANLSASQNYIADIKQVWTTLSEIEQTFLGQHLIMTWEDHIAKVGLRRITLMPPVSDADGEYFRHHSFLEAHTEHNALDIPYICSSPEDFQRQRDWVTSAQETSQNLAMRLEQFKKEQRRDIYQLQEREEQRARDKLNWIDKLSGNEPYVRPPRPTIHCCPY